MTRAEKIEEAARALLAAMDEPLEILPAMFVDQAERYDAKREALRRALAQPATGGRTLRDRVNEPGFAALVAGKVAAMSVRCRCGREAHEHYWQDEGGDAECPGFSADLDQPPPPPDAGRCERCDGTGKRPVYSAGEEMVAGFEPCSACGGSGSAEGGR